MIRCSSLIFIVSVLFGCNKPGKNDFKLSTREIKIPITFKQLAFYPVASILHTDTAELFLGYNYAYNTIDFFDVGRSIFLHSVKIATEGPQSATNLSQLYAGKKFIVASSPPLVYKIGYDGSLLKKYNYDSFKGGVVNYTLDPDIQISNFKQLYYNEEDDFILKNLFNVPQKLSSEYYAKSVLFCKVYLDENRIEPILAGYPEEFSSSGFFGDLDIPYGFYENDSLVYNFPVLSKVFIHYASRILEKEVTPNSMPMASPTLSREKYKVIEDRLKHFLTSPQFFGVIKHSHLQFYLRAHKGPTEEIGLDNSKNYITFISRGLDRSYEVPIDQNFNPMPFPTSDGILFQYKPVESEDFLVLEKITLGDVLLKYLTQVK